MRRTNSRMFRGQDLSRLMMMIVLLCVVGILFFRARDPGTWKWFARGDADASSSVESKEVAAKQLARAETLATKPKKDERLRISSLDESNAKSLAETKTADASDQGAKDEKSTPVNNAAKSDAVKSDPVSENPPIIYKEHVEKSDEQLEAEQKARDAKEREIPIDEDFEELSAAKNEFGAVLDRELALNKIEMKIYKRLVRWVDAQSYEKLSARATQKFRFHDLTTAPDEHRGQLLKLDLKLVRIVKLEDVEGFAGHTELYELWGTTDDSVSHLYELVVADLPKELIPKGIVSNVRERISFAGYFFKIQGYENAVLQPQDKRRLSAPLLIGRMKWHPEQIASGPAATNSDNPEYATLWWLLGLGIIFMGYLGLRFWLKPASVAPVRLSDRTLDEASFEDWLDSSESETPSAEKRSRRSGPAFDWQSDSEENNLDRGTVLDRDNGESGEDWKSSY